MSNFYVGEVLFETGGTIDTPGDINVTAICDCTGSVGTAGQLLSSTGTALEWTTAGSAGIPCSILTAQGDIVVATGANAPAALPVGTDGQVLYACSTATSGLCWAAPAGGSEATPLASGTVYGCTPLSDTGSVRFGYCSAPSVTGLFNTYIGALSGRAASTAGCNVAVGRNALCGTAAGSSNVAIGVDSLLSNFAGSQNVAVGRSTMGSASGSNNVAIGFAAGGATFLTTGSNNVLIGFCVAPASATGSCQLAIGFSGTDNWLTGTSTKAIRPGAGIIDCAGSCGTNGQVLMSNGSNAICWAAAPSTPDATPTGAGKVLGCTVLNNAFIGCSAGGANPTGIFNAGFGSGSLAATTTGCCNTGVGAGTLFSNVTGNFNTAVGGGALCGNTGSNNTAVGTIALGTNTSGNENVAVGRAALGVNTSGSGNTVIGTCAGNLISTGANNVAIGCRVQVASPTGSCQLAIGFSNVDNWLTGTSTKAIKPGAGIIDCAGSCGTNGQVLMSNGSNAICWGSAPGGGIPASTLTAKGDLITATAASTPTALGVGTNGQVLTACSTCSTGLVWATPASGVYAVSTSGSYSFTTGTPVQVLNFGNSNSVIDATLTIPVLNNGSVGAVWKFVKSGDPTNFNTGWNPYFQWPSPSSYNPGSFSMLYPVYPDPLAGNMILEYTPAENVTTTMTLVIATLFGSAPTWMI